MGTSKQIKDWLIPAQLIFYGLFLESHSHKGLGKIVLYFIINVFFVEFERLCFVSKGFDISKCGNLFYVYKVVKFEINY